MATSAVESPHHSWRSIVVQLLRPAHDCDMTTIGSVHYTRIVRVLSCKPTRLLQSIRCCLIDGAACAIVPSRVSNRLSARRPGWMEFTEVSVCQPSRFAIGKIHNPHFVQSAKG